MGYQPNPWMMLPFGLLLAAMAIGPLLFRPWWERHYGKTVLALGAITVGYYLLFLPAPAAHTLARSGQDYVSFIALLGSLFVVAGGIHLTVKGQATPPVNVLFLLVGALLANVLGTVGASLLLIRPWLRLNGRRARAHHVIFFIFLVSNAGGCLVPFGNPPLFLGYLMGVPFWWVAEHCWPMWVCAVGFLLAAFYGVDRFHYRRAPAPPPSELAEPWHVEGLCNLVFLAVILAAVCLSRPVFLREGLMLAAAAASWFTTRKTVHEANQFDFHPIVEVAILFLGIFATMVPALDWLRSNARAALGANPSPAIFYWGSGTLSSLLDNAPTYLSFFSAWLGVQGMAPGQPDRIAQVLAGGHAQLALTALSVASVFFGGCTYIGNGPNFMVKAIAGQRGVPLPGFLGYILKWTMPVMLPLLIMIWLIFFR
ncbi:MAG TPA: sodium:proton antiporter [Candidatus Acidoferrum sp.]|nr:sodium:proton antiporter [Candidatus Acidoferrum sp.]